MDFQPIDPAAPNIHAAPPIVPLAIRRGQRRPVESLQRAAARNIGNKLWWHRASIYATVRHHSTGFPRTAYGYTWWQATRERVRDAEEYLEEVQDFLSRSILDHSIRLLLAPRIQELEEVIAAYYTNPYLVNPPYDHA